MKLNTLLLTVCSCVLCACATGTSSSHSSEINIGAAMDVATSFTLADMGYKLRVVPLETADRCLIGDRPTFTMWKNQLIILSESQPVYVFDTQTGRFLHQVGRFGQGPEEYPNSISVHVDKGNGNIYVRESLSVLLFFGIEPSSNPLLVFSPDGKFVRKCTLDFSDLPGKKGIHDLLIVNDTLWMHNLYYSAVDDYYLARFDMQTGAMIDYRTQAPISPNPWQIGSPAGFKTSMPSKTYASNQMFIHLFKDGKNCKFNCNAPTLWNYDGQYMLKEDFVDTIFTIRDEGLQPRFALDFGKHHWSYDKRMNDHTSQYAFPDLIFEDDHIVYFHLLTHYYDEQTCPWVGYYNKATGKTRVMQADYIPDPNTGIPISIVGQSSDGKLYGLIYPTTLTELQEADKVRNIPTIADDDNPVLLIIEPE